MRKVERKHFNNWQLHFTTITADDSFAVAVAQLSATATATVVVVITRIVAAAVSIIPSLHHRRVRMDKILAIAKRCGCIQRYMVTTETFNGAQWCDYYLCSQATHRIVADSGLIK